jgi:hypothetical protein
MTVLTIGALGGLVVTVGLSIWSLRTLGELRLRIADLERRMRGGR